MRELRLMHLHGFAHLICNVISWNTSLHRFSITVSNVESGCLVRICNWFSIFEIHCWEQPCSKLHLLSVICKIYQCTLLVHRLTRLWKPLISDVLRILSLGIACWHLNLQALHLQCTSKRLEETPNKFTNQQTPLQLSSVQQYKSFL